MKEFKKLTPFKMCVLQNFPFIEADFDALTNYELMCKIVEYLNKVNENVNILSNIVEKISQLDIQEEVNKKLDEMVEDGTLEQIISKYFKYITPETFGAVGDGITDDTNALQQWLDYHISNKDALFDISSKTYAITSTLDISYEEENYLIDFKNATIKAISDMDSMIEINTVPLNNTWGTDISDKYRTIRGGHFDGNLKANDIIYYRSRKIRIENIHLINAKNVYINIERGALILNGAFLDKRNYNLTDSIGIKITQYASDSKISNVQARDIKTFIVNGGASNFFMNCHAWLVNILRNTIFCEYSKPAIFDNCYPDTYNTIFKAANGSQIMFTNCNLFWNTTLLPADYEQPILMEHATGYEGNINVNFVNCLFDLATLNTFGLKLKYYDTPRTNANLIGREDSILQYNSINPSYLDNFPIIANYRNITIETITERNPANGSITFSEVRYIGNGFVYIKGKFTNTLGTVNANYSFAQMSQENIKITETTYLTAFCYNSNTPNNKTPVVMDIADNGYFHAYPTQNLSNIDRIEFSGIIRCNLLQAY